jgi:hypothetical protein
MPTFLILLAVIALSVVALGAVNMMPPCKPSIAFVRAQSGLALIVIGLGMTTLVFYIYAMFDLVPKEIGSELRQAPDDTAHFTPGGKQGNDFRISRMRGVNAIQLPSVFVGRERVYMYTWQQIHGLYWNRIQ